MLRLLTDEHISPQVAQQARSRCRGLSIIALPLWEGGQYLGCSDETILTEAHKQKLTLVTFDLRTIPPLLRSWAEAGREHGGVVLVDGRTLTQNNIGGLVMALCALWQKQRNEDWIDRVVFLRANA